MTIRNPILPGFNPDPSIGPALFAILKAVALMIYALNQKRVDEIEQALYFTEAGLQDNLEFNVELKNRSDYEFALQKFNELWGQPRRPRQPGTRSA